MQDFEEQERRLMAALGRLGAAVERLSEAPPAAEVEAAGMLDTAADVEIARLSQLLETARAETQVAQAETEAARAEAAAARAEAQAMRAEGQTLLAEAEALRTELESSRAEAEAARAETEPLNTDAKAQVAARHSAELAELQDRAEALRTELATRLSELQRLRQVNLQIREALYALRQALSAGVADAGAINQSLAAEVEALRASRSGEGAEIDALLRALEPLVAEGVAAAAATKETDNA